MTGSLSGERAVLKSRRQTGSHSKRGRKVYRITDEGRRLFATLLESERTNSTDDARSFGLRLAFARYLPPQARLRLLERRRSQLVERLFEVREAIASASERLDVYARSLMQHASESTERDITWLDQLIEAERSRGVPHAPASRTRRLKVREGDLR